MLAQAANWTRSRLLGSYGLPTVGFGLLGASAFLLLAVGPRLLGPDAYSSLALAWVIVAMFGAGVGIPGEQTATRRVAAGHSLSVTRSVRTRLVALAVVIAAMMGIVVGAGWQPFGPDSGWWVVSCTVGMAGWGLVVGPRGVLAGLSDYAGYAAVLVVEAAGRALLVLGALLFPQLSIGLLQAAVGVPLLVAAAVAAFRQREDTAEGRTGGHGQRAEHAETTGVAVASQIVLNTAPLWLNAHAVGSAALVGAYVSASAYLRIPIVFSGGVLAVILSKASALAASRDRISLERFYLSAFTWLTAGTAVLVSGLFLAAPLGLAVLYGPDLGISTATLVILAFGTLGFMAAYLLTQFLLAEGASRQAALGWLSGAVVCTASLALLARSPEAAAASTLIGVVVAGGMQGALGVRIIRRPRRRRADSSGSAG